MAIEVREVRREEHEETGRVAMEAYREYDGRIDSPGWPGFFASLGDVAGRAERAVVLVAVQDGTVLGTLTLELDDRVSRDDDPLPPGHAAIRMLGVAPEARGLGVGKALVEAAEQRASDAGRTHMTLYTSELMEVARKIYLDRGYVQGPDLVMNERLTLLTYVKELGPASE